MWRVVLTTVLALAMALMGAIGPLHTAGAEEETARAMVRILDSAGNNVTEGYVGWMLYKGSVTPYDSSESAGRIASDVTYASDTARTVIQDALNRYGQEENNGTAFTRWYEKSEYSKPGSLVARDAPQVTAKYVADTIAQEERNGHEVGAAEGTLTTLDGRTPNATDANGLASLLVEGFRMAYESGTVAYNSSRHAFVCDKEGFCVFAPRSGAIADGTIDPMSEYGYRPVYAPVYFAVGSAETSIDLTVKTDLPCINKEVQSDEGTLSKTAIKKPGDTAYRITTRIPAGVGAIAAWKVVDTLPKGMHINQAQMATKRSTDPDSAFSFVGYSDYETVDGEDGATVTFDLTSVCNQALSQRDASTLGDELPFDVAVGYTVWCDEHITFGAREANVNSAKLVYSYSEAREDETAISSASLVAYKLKLVVADGTVTNAGATDVAHISESDLANASFALTTNGYGYDYQTAKWSEALMSDGIPGVPSATAHGDQTAEYTVLYAGDGTYTFKAGKVPNGYDSLDADVSIAIKSAVDNKDDVTDLVATVSGGNAGNGAPYVLSADLATGEITVVIPFIKNDIVLPITGMTPSQLGIVIGAALLVVGAVGFVALNAYRRKAARES